MIYNFNLGIGWASSGVEYAQVYRRNVFRRINEPSKFIFSDMFPSENIQHLTANMGFEDSEVIWMYSFFTDIPLSPVTFTTEELEKTFGTSEFTKKEESDKIIKYIFSSGAGDFATVYLAREKTNLVHRVELVSGGKLIRKDYYTFCKIYSEYYAPLNGKAHMYLRRFFNQDKSVAYEEINDDDNVVFKFPDRIFYSKEELVAEFIRRLNLTKDDIMIIDRTTGVGQSILENVRPAKVGVVIHAEHFSEGSFERDNILWNNYYEYSFNNFRKIDFFIASTRAQKELCEEQFMEVYGEKPVIYDIPVGSIDELKYSEDRKKHSLITASRLANEKHVDWLVSAVIKAREQIENITFDIYGKGVAEDRLKEIIADNHAEDYIKLCGHQKLDEIYKGYEAYVAASTSEGFGLTLLEAIGSGLPIVGFDVRYGNKTFIEHGVNGYKIPITEEMDGQEKTDLLAEHIVKLFKENDLEKCREKSYSIAKEYVTEKVEEKWKNLIAQMK